MPPFDARDAIRVRVNILAIENLVVRNSGRLINGNQVKRLTEEELVGIEPDSGRRLAVQTNLAVMHALNGQIDRIESAINAKVSGNEELQSLKSALPAKDRRPIRA